MKKKRYIQVIVSVLIMLGMSVGCIFYVSAESEETGVDKEKVYVADEVETAYVYPVIPASDEWIELGSYKARVEACRVPEEVLETMSTRQLVDTFLDYPFLVNFYLFTRYEQAFECLYEISTPLPVLLEKEDCMEELSNAYEDLANVEEKDVYDKLKIDVLEWMLVNEDALNRLSEN